MTPTERAVMSDMSTVQRWLVFVVYLLSITLGVTGAALLDWLYRNG